ncbi:hypothetical protein N2152v2_007616 [Parachlorella kessleri]
MEASFLEKRLAAATKIRPRQRSPEVAAFIECCQLQQGLTQELQRGLHSTHQQQALADLKLTRSHIISPTVPLWYREPPYAAAWERLRTAAALQASEPIVNAGDRITALTDMSFTLPTLLLVAAGAPRFVQAHITRLLPAYNNIVERMQLPALAARLRQELAQLQADLPRTLLSYEQLLAHFLYLASQEASAKLTPRLVPEDLHLQFIAMAGGFEQCEHWSHHTVQYSQLLEQAQRVGSDFTVALCGYQLADVSVKFGVTAVVEQQLGGQLEGTSAGLPASFPPSAFLGWLQQAERAHAQCSAVLPLQWTAGLERRQQAALAWKPWLQRQQQEGDRWQLPGAEELSRAQAEAAAQARELVADPAARITCSGCGESSPHLRSCSGCRQARYCR